jgi:diacylglycerol kinase family enzyme
MASLGIDGKIIKKRDSYVVRGEKGIQTYLKAAIREYFWGKNRITATVKTGEITVKMQNLLNLMVVKQPYYGYGLNVIPKARLDDGKLHLLGFKSNLFAILIGGVTALTIGNRVGRYLCSTQANVRLKRPAELQIDGSPAWAGNRFDFLVLPNALNMVC